MEYSNIDIQIIYEKNVTYVKIDKTNLEFITDGKYFIILRKFVSFHPETFNSIFDIIMLYVEISLHWSLKPVLQRTEGGRRQMSGCSCVSGERRDTRRPAPK